MNKYGHSKGVLKDKGAVRYYQGLARGRNINWMGLVDAQLKTVGHDGLWPDERPQLYNLYEGKDEKGKTIADPQKFQPIIKAVERAQQNPTKQNVIYAYQLLRDTFPDSQIPSSVWDDPEEVLSFLQ